MARRKKYSFLKKKKSKEARIAMLLTGLSLLLLLVLPVLFAFVGQKAGLAIASAGLLGILLAMYALILSLKLLVKRTDTYVQAGIATLFSGSLCIFWIFLILWGLNR